MNSTFLGKIAEELLAGRGKDLSDTVVVVPGQRAGHRLKQELARSVGVSWAPTTVTFPGFFELLTGHQASRPIDLTFGLYQGLRAIEKDQSINFDEFLDWSGIVLSDFNDIDQHLLDAKQVFRNLEDYADIENWSFAHQPWSPQQQQFAGFWKRMGELYTWFNEWQERTGIFSYGHLVRKVCSAPALFLPKIAGKKIYFIGVQALSPGEEELVQLLKQQHGAQLFFDGDTMYCDDIKGHEAGSFIRKMRKNGTGDKWTGTYFRDDEKTIRIAEANTSVGQVWGALQFYQQSLLSEKVIVLNDEHLAGPLCEAFNSQGIPVSFRGSAATQTQVFGLIKQWLRLLIHLENYGSNAGLPSDVIFHFLSHPIIRSSEPELGPDFHEWMIRKNFAVIRQPDIRNFMEGLPMDSWLRILSPGILPSVEDWITQVLHVIKRMFSHPEMTETWRMEWRMANDWLLTAREWSSQLPLNYKSLLKLLTMEASSGTIPVDAPLEGAVQVMGLMETRSLDFEHVIFLGADEKNLPGTQAYNSFIPHDIRTRYRLPVKQEREAMFAYNFYRLLQRASQVDILFSMSSEDFNLTEPSRYITQVIHEFPLYNPGIRIERLKLKTGAAGVHAPKAIATNDFVRTRLKELFAKGISPSALNTFNRCPLDFYYKYVIGLNEAEEVEENFDRAVFGQIVHKVLENFYSQYIGSFPTESELKKLITESRQKVEECLDSVDFRNYSWSGENALALDIAAEMVVRFAESEIRELSENDSMQKQITGIEVDIEWSFELTEPGWTVKIRGKADRIETIGDQTRFLDYKTGGVDATHLKEPKDGDVFGNTGKSKLVQLYLYQYMYCRMKKLSPAAVVPGIYSMRNHRQGILWLDNASIEVMGESAWFERIESGIHDSVKRIFETEHFVHDNSSDFCSYCNT